MRPRGLRLFLRDLLLGVRLDYPLCCMLHCCWDGIWGWPSAMVRWRQIDTDPTHLQPCVPCGLLHVGGSRLPVGARLRAVARFQRRHLPGGSRHNACEPARKGSRRWRDATTEEVFAACPSGAAYRRLYWGLETG
jgi:hypothetical protein